MATKLCLSPRCPNPATYRGRCAAHSTERNRDTHSGDHRIYNLKRWKTTRRRQLFSQPLCAECGAIASEVDHILPLARGGQPYSATNLQSLCHPCHSRKTREEQRVGEGRP